MGLFVDILPGAGPTIATFMSYAVEKKASKHPHDRGHGAIEGVAGSELANNAASTQAVVSMLTLGIPGSATRAIMPRGFEVTHPKESKLALSGHCSQIW